MAEAANSGLSTENVPGRVIAFRLLLVHYGLYALTNVVVLTINALTTPGNWWFLWVVGGWGIIFAAHTGYFLWGPAGAHVMAFILGNICLIAIDLIYSDQRWFYWVLLPWLIVLILHLVLTTSCVRRRHFEWESMLAQPPAHNDAERRS